MYSVWIESAFGEHTRCLQRRLDRADPARERVGLAYVCELPLGSGHDEHSPWTLSEREPLAVSNQPLFATSCPRISPFGFFAVCTFT